MPRNRFLTGKMDTSPNATASPRKISAADSLRQDVHAEAVPLVQYLRPKQQKDAAVAILSAGGMNDGVQQQTQRIDENMPFLALDQFARIKPVRIDVRPPFRRS
jgi:hypothetical protein